MAEQWTRKYRPTTIETYVGNTRLKEEVIGQLAAGTLPQMMLLQGPAGTGKTTLARLIAKSMVCLNPQEGHACGECMNCLNLTDSYILNGETALGAPVRDYNISNMNTVEDAERIIQEMQQISAFDNKKVYILDEVQEASPRAQAAFLKIAEEPPAGLHIILCTTHPQKLATAFKSRFISRRVQKPTVQELVDRLVYICQREGVNYEVKGLQLLVTKIGRTPRDCINQAEYLGNLGAITRKNVEESLGVIGYEEYIQFINSVKLMDFVAIDQMYQDLQSKGTPMDSFIRGFGDFIVVCIKAKRFNESLANEYSPNDLKMIRRVVRKIDDSKLAEIITVTRGFTGDISEFEYYAYVFELNKILGTVDTSTSDNTTYQEVTESVNNKVIRREGTETIATAADLHSIFANED